MPNPFILRGVSQAWSKEAGRTMRVLDLSCGDGDTARLLSENAFKVVATEYDHPPFLGKHISRDGGVNKN